MKSRGFTLIELLVVLVIILVLAGLVTGISKSAGQSAKKNKAKAMIETLGVAIGMHQVDTGQFPISNGGTGSWYLYICLRLNWVSGWAGPYMEFNKEDLLATANPNLYNIKDPWGRAYNYRMPGTTTSNRRSFDLWSNGPDGAPGTSDDIKNW